MSENSTAVVLEQIEELRAASLEREAALRDIATQLPAVVSRRAVLRDMARDLRSVPDRGSLAKRVVAKAALKPSAMLAQRRLR